MQSCVLSCRCHGMSDAPHSCKPWMRCLCIQQRKSSGMKILSQVNISLEKVAWLYQNSTYSFSHYMITSCAILICSDWSQHVCMRTFSNHSYCFITLWCGTSKNASHFILLSSKLPAYKTEKYEILGEVILNGWEYGPIIMAIIHQFMLNENMTTCMVKRLKISKSFQHFNDLCSNFKCT
jgi:hypothetical protein